MTCQGLLAAWSRAGTSAKRKYKVDVRNKALRKAKRLGCGWARGK